MITAFLAGSGGPVVMPQAMSAIMADTDNEVRFVDSEGRVLAVFQCPDVAMYRVGETGDDVVVTSPPASDGPQ